MTRATIAAPVVMGALALSVGLSACSGAGGAGGSAGGTGGSADSVNVLMVNNPQMVDLQKLAPAFTKETGIKVNFTVLPENDLRDKTSQEFSSQAGQYDVATLSNFEIPIYAKNKWVADLTSYSTVRHGVQPGRHPPADDQGAVTVDGKIYGEPFYGESSFLMYRKDVLQAKGVDAARQAPTWQEVADIGGQGRRPPVVCAASACAGNPGGASSSPP